MPVVNVQPARASSLGIQISTYVSPSTFPEALWAALYDNERAANVVLPHALNSLHTRKEVPGQFWMTCETSPSLSSPSQLEFILSCTEWCMGTYPIFIMTTLPTSSLTPAFLIPRIAMLVAEVQARTAKERVYSIFAPAPIAKAFAQTWSSVTGVQLEENPYYAARFSFCTRKSLEAGTQPIPPPNTTYNLRLAFDEDIPKVASLCKGFAADSEPFVLDDAGALKEATYLVSNRIAWVHEVIQSGASDIACLVVTTRNSDNVTSITKVYTSPCWRKRGCAERLVRRVCQEAFLVERKKWVVLYVAHNNPAAAKVYDRVGFFGLCGKPRIDGVDDWVEIGCRGAFLGHW